MIEPRRGPALHGQFRPPLFLSALLMVVLAATVHGALAVQPRLVGEMDSSDWLKMSLNAAVHGVMSYNDHRLSEVAPTLNRPPFYSFLASLAIRAGSDPAKHSVSCIFKQSDPGCRSVVVSAQVFNLASLAALAGAAALLGWALGGAGLGVASGLLVAANTFFVSSVAIVSPEILAALLVTLASLWLVLCYRRPHAWWPWILAGLTLGLLSLTKPVFTYSLPLMALVAFLGLRAHRELRWRDVLLPVGAAMVIAASLPGAWMARNAIILDRPDLTVDEKASIVLAVRAAYTTMEWRELLPAMVSFTPTVGPPLMKRLFEPGDIQRLLPAPGRNRDSFYIDHEKIVMDAAAKIDPGLRTASEMRRSVAVILHNIDKHIALVPVFAYSGLYPRSGSGAYQELMGGLLGVPIAALAIGLSILVLSLAMLAIWAAPLLVLAKRAEPVWFVAVLIPLYSVTFHAGLTHYIGRYSNMVTAVGMVLVAAGLCHLLRRLAPGFKRAAKPA